MRTNPVTISGSVAYLECRTGFVTCSVEDLPQIQQHYWRIIEGIPYSSIQDGEYEVKTSLHHFLTDRHRHVPLITANGNLLDLTRENLQDPNEGTNVYRKCGRVGTLTIDNKVTITIDEDSIPYMKQYQWQLKPVNGGYTIYSYIPQLGRSRVSLAKFLVGNSDYSKVTHKNNDPNDFRLHNIRGLF